MLLEKITKEVKKLFQLKSSNNSVHRQEEIQHLKKRLMEFDIHFSSLVYQPTEIKKQDLIEISKRVARNGELLNKLTCSEKKISVEQIIINCSDIPLKVLKEHQKFIITMAFILSGPYPSLREYIERSIL
ncbi:hypothetical protein [Paenibacillus aestuarii]|uniref:Uncharacterized protein n=1 Tax=Paenibacillus aestuarii TaxID=516965 RepID=A0ABW0KET2_9BACL|nr:hypothetical protein [Paenibacillus aestuarii]